MKVWNIFACAAFIFQMGMGKSISEKEVKAEEKVEIKEIQEVEVKTEEKVEIQEVKTEEKVDETKTEKKQEPSQGKNNILSTIRFIKSSNDAISASKRLKFYVKEIGDSFFKENGIAFRSDSPFFKKYMVELPTDQKEILKLQLSDATELKAETEILVKDLENFLHSTKVKQSINDFLEQNKRIIAHLDQARSHSTPFIMSFFQNLASSNEQSSEKAEQILKKFREYIEQATNEESDVISEKSRQSAYASMYLIASIFNNNGTRIAYLYDNETVIEYMGQYISKKYGDNPLLGFALELAPFIDVVNREFGFNWSTTKALLAQYQSLFYTAVGVGGVLVLAYCYNNYQTPVTNP